MNPYNIEWHHTGRTCKVLNDLFDYFRWVSVHRAAVGRCAVRQVCGRLLRRDVRKSGRTHHTIHHNPSNPHSCFIHKLVCWTDCCQIHVYHGLFRLNFFFIPHFCFSSTVCSKISQNANHNRKPKYEHFFINKLLNSTAKQQFFAASICFAFKEYTSSSISERLILCVLQINFCQISPDEIISLPFLSRL